MTGVLVLPDTATEAEWLDRRRRGITASEIAVVLGLSPYGSPFELYHRKTGDLPASQPDNIAMALGRHLEGFVVTEFEKRRAGLFTWGDGRDLFAHPDRPWQLATPDRTVHEQVSGGSYSRPLAVLEAKTSASYDGWGDDGGDEIPVHYRCQVLWQMDVMGVPAGFAACLFLHSRQVRVYELTLDTAAEADLLVMRSEAALFLNRVDRRDPPGVDWRPATTGALKALHPNIDDRAVAVKRMPVIRYQAACRAFKAAEQRKKAAENQLRLLLGDGRQLIDAATGQVVATRQVYDVREHTRAASTTDKLIPARSTP